MGLSSTRLSYEHLDSADLISAWLESVLAVFYRLGFGLTGLWRNIVGIVWLGSTGLCLFVLDKAALD